jgi:hypothetical protein
MVYMSHSSYSKTSCLVIFWNANCVNPERYRTFMLRKALVRKGLKAAKLAIWQAVFFGVSQAAAVFWSASHLNMTEGIMIRLL